jgi:hypothetical protein
MFPPGPGSFMLLPVLALRLVDPLDKFAVQFHFARRFFYGRLWFDAPGCPVAVSQGLKLHGRQRPKAVLIERKTVL